MGLSPVSRKPSTLRVKSATLPMIMQLPHKCTTSTVLPQPPRVEMDFTNAQLTGFGASPGLGQLAERSDLPEALSAMSVKQHTRGASDAETLWSLIASLSGQRGAVGPRCVARGPGRPPSAGSRRCALGPAVLASIWHASTRRRSRRCWRWRAGWPGRWRLRWWNRKRRCAACPGVRRRHRDRGRRQVVRGGAARPRRHAPVLAAWGCSSALIGALWASGRPHPGGVDVAGGWREQLDRDLARRLPEGAPVWLRADNVYYRGELID